MVVVGLLFFHRRLERTSERRLVQRGRETSAMTTRKLAGVGGEVSGRESIETPPPPLHLLYSQSSVQGGA